MKLTPVPEDEQNQFIKQSELIKSRPGMYLGSILGVLIELVHLFLQDVLDNQCNQIDITVHTADQFTVAATYIQHDSVKEFTETFGKLLRGTHRVESHLLNFAGMYILSLFADKLDVSIRGNSQQWQFTCKNGQVQISDPQKSAPVDQTRIEITCQLSLPELNRVVGGKLEYDRLAGLLQQKAMLIPGLRLSLTDERQASSTNVFHYQEGILSYLKRPLVILYRDFPKLLHRHLTVKRDQGDEMRFEYVIGFIFGAKQYASIHSYVNARPTLCHGVHVNAIVDAVVLVVNETAAALADPCYTRAFEPIDKEAANQRLISIVSVWHPEPESDDPMRWRLTSPDVYEPLYSHALTNLRQALADDPEWAKCIIFWYCPRDDED
jgi:DNA gyrase/topoisomerase IV subunit B